MKVINNKTNLSFLQKFSLLLFFSFTSLNVSTAQCDDNFVAIGSYHVEFVGVEYDFPQAGQSTWFYSVYATAGKDISHVTFPLNKNCISVLDAGIWGADKSELFSGQGEPEVGKDPKAKIWGVKFDEGVDTGNEQNYFFTVEGNLEIAPVHEVAIKAGRPFYKGTVCGPSPDCTEVTLDPEPIESCISGLAFRDDNRNGIREAGELPLPNVTVTLIRDFAPADVAVTGTDGTYSFCGLGSGSYIIKMDVAVGILQTPPNVGDDAFDSDILGEYNLTEPREITTEGESYSNVDGGFFRFGSWDLGFVLENPNIKLKKTTDKDKARKIAGSYPNTFVDIPNTSVLSKPKSNVFPNPVVNVATFNIPTIQKTDVRIEILNQSGQPFGTSLIKAGENSQQMDLSNLPNGIYFVQFISEEGITVERIVKSN